MHLRKLPSGNWRVIAKVNGSQASASAPTKAEAKRLGNEMELALGVTPRTSNSPLSELFEAHLSEQGYAATTLVDLRRIVAKLPEDVLAWNVAKIEPVAVEALYRRLRKEGWTPFRLEKLHMLMSSSWHRARRYGWAKRNIMVDVDRPKVTSTEHSPPDSAEVRRLLAGATIRTTRPPVHQVAGRRNDEDTAARQHAFVTYLRVAAMTGARRGEVVGLQWGDIDLDTSQLIVRRAVSHVPGHVGPVISEGKTGRKGHRVVALDPNTIEMLRTLHDTELRFAAVDDLTPIWTFSHDAGATPWRGDFVSREFRRLRDELGIPVRLHDLRHWMATTALKAGLPLSAVADRLGHSSGTTTQAVYSHYVPASDQAVSALMSSSVD